MREVLLDFAESFAAGLVAAGEGVNASPVSAEHGPALRLEVVVGGSPRHVAVRAPAGRWDVTAHLYVGVEVRNAGASETIVSLEVHSDGAEAWGNRNDITTVLAPGEAKLLKALIVRLPLSEDSALGRYFAGANGVPGGEYSSSMLGLPGGFTWHWNRIDPSQVTQVVVCVPFPTGGETLEIMRVTAEGRYDPPSEQVLAHGFAPFVDAFGQYRYHEWPGKARSADDLARARAAEDAELAAHPSPPDWDRHGGWAGGPQLTATGRFRPIKHEGKWWLVDPEGRLFWSHGVDCIGLDWAATRIVGREQWFADLPEEGDPLRDCFRERDGKRFGYSFSRANLRRKYGDDWRAVSIDRVHQRLRSWGMNTVANWSSPEVYLQRKTPYVIDVHYDSRQIEGNHKLPDPFDPGFREAIRTSLERRRDSFGDAWCLGYFVDNELDWQRDVEAAVLVAKAPPDQAAKQVLLEDLQDRYQAVEELNSAWGAHFASWRECLESREAPGPGAHDDLAAFFDRMAEEYFRGCREVVKAADPDALYLGCRLHQLNPRVVRAAAKHCDVLSINCYRYDARTMELPADLDRPVMIGEWHFGALDRGPLHPGLRHVQDQSERAVMYPSYLRSALSHPLMVGAHWFQYGDQATTGRDDGENCQNGFVDVCDAPYEETVRACREAGSRLYQYRFGGP